MEVLFDPKKQQEDIDKHESQGWHCKHEIKQINGQDYMLFGGPTKYHKGSPGNWVFDKEAALDAEVRPEKEGLIREALEATAWDLRAKMTAAKVEEWRVYIEDLRNIEQTITTEQELAEVEWPTKPKD